MQHSSGSSGDELQNAIARALFDARPHRNYNSQTKQFVTPIWDEQPTTIRSVFLNQADNILLDLPNYVGQQTTDLQAAQDKILQQTVAFSRSQQACSAAEERVTLLDREVVRLRALVYGGDKDA